VDQDREGQWSQWLRQGLAGDEEAYRQFLESLAAWLRGTTRNRCRRMGIGAAEVEDVVQESLLAIHLKRNTWRASDPVSPWVAAISRNKLVDVMRRHGRRAELSLDDVDESAIPSVAADESAGHDVQRVLESLDERQRNIVRLVSIEGRSSRDAAQSLGMSEGALRVALHRALRALASQLRKEG
jgi:RNA polymerase sigma factor (sigma-70 family)